ncbi:MULTISPECIES: MgtC/SapB family protein [unclassified Bacillus (in: firmicutes)]|uniref:MgtC/SapB family protein n=1 Tax=unclassified Bacillus (in: firmicutes) TaxID=185979 RepID=UPI00080AED74|nr:MULTISPECIES: MgtC/SapB family protein [unclassified Bacillus (in: firmicutes)]OCA84921.1 MgtC/SapB transporter [Bacillus sp. FJAT-27986]
MDFSIDIQMIIKLCISAVLGLIIGLEREIKRKPVGLKTSLVISIVSCLLTIVSIESAYNAKGSAYGVTVTMDPLRLAAQIVSGIGFIGAGVILRRGNDSISGLTTAALIWGAGGIGITVGAGFYMEAIAGVVLLIISVELLPMLFNYIGPKKFREKELNLQLIIAEKDSIAPIINLIEQKEISIKSVRIKDLTNSHQIRLRTTIDSKRLITDVYYSVSSIDGVMSIEIENA